MTSQLDSSVFITSFYSWQESIPVLLERSSLGRSVTQHGAVLIKPNLVENLEPPITTPVNLVKEIVDYLLHYLPKNQIIIGEGCGATSYDTHYAFETLGYKKLATSRGISLLDLNTEKLCRKEQPGCNRWPEMYLPEILDEVFLLSVPTLKAHSLSGVTLTMKNMMGCAPPSHYKGGGAWNKAAFHKNIHEAIFDLNRYRTPDFTLLDATIGMAKAHLWGPHCSPPVGKVAASFDPVALDSYGTKLLQRRWQDIPHIVMANTVLGNAENYQEIYISPES